ncbi:MAG: hypothetical protein JW967_10550 [Dehalococcoidales bacterium]|nr:hypothetical protein [Dehalococcoidales bacterium]
MPDLNIPTFVAWLLNFVILAGILILVYYFVIRDARKRRMKLLHTIIWTIISVLTFPIGFLFYLLVVRRNSWKFGKEEL